MPEEIVTVEVKQDGVNVGNATRSKGDKVDMPRSEAEILQKSDIVDIIEEAKAAPEVEELGESGKQGVNVENMLPGGDFLKADDVEEGETVRILGTGKTDSSFDQERLVLPIRFMEEERRVSLGPENIERIADEYGMNTQNWVGEKIKVALIKKYQGLGKKGIVWKPVKGD